MAGRPMMQTLNFKIEELGGDEYIFDRIANGDPIGDIAEGLGVSRSFLYKWRKQPPKELAEERKQKWHEAMELSAEAKDEQGAKILDETAENPAITSGQASIAKSRAQYRQWQAEMRSSEYRKNNGQDVNVNVNLHSIHLDALRARVAERQLAREQPREIESGEVLEAEVIEETADQVVEAETEETNTDGVLAELKGL